MNALVLEDVDIALSGAGGKLICGLDVHIAPGEIVTVMGKSGAGKSTLLSFVSGHLSTAFEASGRVLCGEKDVTALPAEERHIGMLFQDDMLFPHLSVGSNLAFGLSASLKGRVVRRAAVEDALSNAGLAGFYMRDPATLSGGQRTRAALMRTLLSAPRALLLDEPFSKLDQAMRAEMRAFVFEHARKQNLPVLMVTHDEADANAAGGHIVRL